MSKLHAWKLGFQQAFSVLKGGTAGGPAGEAAIGGETVAEEILATLIILAFSAGVIAVYFIVLIACGQEPW